MNTADELRLALENARREQGGLSIHAVANIIGEVLYQSEVKILIKDLKDCGKDDETVNQF